MIKTIQDYSYKVNEHIGKGYSSTVHKGINEKNGEQICIKVIEMSKLEDPINQILLQYQVSALRALSFSNHILHLNDVYATKNNTYIITQLCQCDLGTLLKQKKQYLYYEAVQILKQLIVGYMDIYRQGYLHRDIKPANIFYKKGVYKFGDFGFAIPIKQIQDHKNYNVGSPVYMPPQALKDNIYSVSCDAWALGIIFFQLLKGIVPWRAISEQKLFEKIMNEPLSEMTAGLPEVARTFLSKILHLDQNQRLTPQQLPNWIEKLFTVEIRQNNPNLNILSPMAVNQSHKAPLQDICCFSDFQNRENNSRLTSHQNVPMKKQESNIIISINQRSPISKNKIIPHRINFLTENDNKQRVSIVKIKENLITNNTFVNNLFECQYYSDQMIAYLKFIHKVIKFIGEPTDFPMKDLEYSLTKHLFKEFQTIQKLKQLENADSFILNKWKQFLTSSKSQKFKKSFKKMTEKYKMFHLLPKDEFVLQVYKDQIISGIQRLSTFLQIEENYSEKAIIALDLLIEFYQIFCVKEKISFKQFLESGDISKFFEQNSYGHKKDYLSVLQNKLSRMNLSFKSQFNLNNMQNNIALPNKNIFELVSSARI